MVETRDGQAESKTATNASQVLSLGLRRLDFNDKDSGVGDATAIFEQIIYFGIAENGKWEGSPITSELGRGLCLAAAVIPQSLRRRWLRCDTWSACSVLFDRHRPWPCFGRIFLPEMQISCQSRGYEHPQNPPGSTLSQPTTSWTESTMCLALHASTQSKAE